jgi:hypothetical protein
MVSVQEYRSIQKTGINAKVSLNIPTGSKVRTGSGKRVSLNCAISFTP